MPFIAASSTLLGIAVLVLYLAGSVRAPSAGIRRIQAGALAADAAEGSLPRSSADRVAAVRRRVTAELERFGERMRTPEGLARRLKWAGVTMRPEAWQALPYPLGGIGAVLGAVLGVALHRDQVVATVAGAGLAAALPTVVLSLRLRARRMHIARDVLSYAEYLAMAMRAGADFRTAIQQVEERFPSPVSEAFSAAILSSGLGGRMDDGLRMVRDELDNPDADVVLDLLSKQYQVGARCADMLTDQIRSTRKEAQERVMEKAGRVAMVLLLPAMVFDLPVVFLIIVFPLLHEAIGFLH